MTWQRLAAPASYARWRDLPAALLRLSSFGLGLGWQLTARLLNDNSVPAEWGDHSVTPRQLLSKVAGVAGHLSVLLFASGAASMLISQLSMRMRVSRSLEVQALLAITAWPHNRSICGTKPLVSPSACMYNQRMFFALNLVRYLLPLAVGPLERPSDNDECVAILLFCQVPLLIEAMAEARLFRHHQRQRRQGGLPLENDWQAHVYGGIYWLTLGGSAPHLCLLYVMVLAACWDLCAFFALSSPAGGSTLGQPGPAVQG
ncbi:hypothetical protein ABPG75_006401 [Micractinium tetrahymenae]